MIKILERIGRDSLDPDIAKFFVHNRKNTCMRKQLVNEVIECTGYNLSSRELRTSKTEIRQYFTKIFRWSGVISSESPA